MPDGNARRIGVFVYGVHKSGTAFLFRFFREVCRQLRISYYSRNGLSVPSNTELNSAITQSFCLCPIRSFDTGGAALSDCGTRVFPHMDALRHIIHVRDPRDALVSLYYSVASIHTPYRRMDIEDFLAYRQEALDIGIDRFVLKSVPIFLDEYAKLKPLDLTRPDFVLVKYETMVGDFPTWVDQVLAAFDVAPRSDLAAKLVRRFHEEFRPAGEQLVHKRKMVPGDHTGKLKPATVRRLNAAFREFGFLGYAFPTATDVLLQRLLPRRPRQTATAAGD